MSSQKGKGCFGALFTLVIIAALVAGAFFVVRKVMPDVLSDIPFAGSRQDNSVPPDFNSAGQRYDELGEAGRIIYYHLYQSVSQGGLICTISGVDHDEYGDCVSDAVLAFVYDHPEYYELSGGFRMSAQTFAGIGRDVITISLDTYDLQGADGSGRDVLMDTAENIAEQAMQYPDDFARAKYAHDYIITHTEYDMDSAMPTQDGRAKNEYSCTAYGCLVQGSAICGGYSKAYQLVLDMLGIECLYITGEAEEKHAWNCIRLDGEWYFVDLTWDDPGMDANKGSAFSDGVLYSYFCIDSEHLLRDHTPDVQPFTVPECTSDRYDYFVYNGYEMDEYTLVGISQIIAKQDGQELISIRFSNEEAFRAACSHLFYELNWSRIPAFSGKSTISYTQNEKMFTLIIKAG